jgi:hypothetical protein
VRYLLTGIDVARWVFQAGWPACGGPDGVEMVRTDEKASDEDSVWLGLFTVLLRIRLDEIQTGASRTPATGSRSGSDPVAASEEEQPLHVDHSTKTGLPKELGKVRECGPRPMRTWSHSG